MSLKLMSLNVEFSRHLERFIPKVREINPDVLCLQEVCEYDLQEISKQIGMKHFVYADKMTIPKGFCDVKENTGYCVVIFSREPLSASEKRYYRKHEPEMRKIPYEEIASNEERQKVQDGVVLLGTYEKEGVAYTIGTLHFTWSFVTETPLQLQDAQNLIDLFPKDESLILCGDFNVPRGHNATYDIFTQRFTDDIPQKYKTSIDADLHKEGHLVRGEELMVDYFFSTDPYQISNVELIDGVSDHMAVIGKVSKKEL